MKFICYECEKFFPLDKVVVDSGLYGFRLFCPSCGKKYNGGKT